MDMQPDSSITPVAQTTQPITSTVQSVAPESLLEQYDSLRKLLIIALTAVLLLAGSFNIFLLGQVIVARKDLNQTNLVLQEFQKNDALGINTFINGLVNFGKTHPDFVPILVKYGFASTNPATKPSPPPPLNLPSGR